MASKAVVTTAVVCLELAAADPNLSSQTHQSHSWLPTTSASSPAPSLTVVTAVDESSNAAVATADDGHASSDGSDDAADSEQSKSAANGHDATNAADDAHDAEHDDSRCCRSKH